ncbi:MAG: 1-acyl-sn-glycerol-3-phosphate acyltransferase [Spirochaetales bacterium]|nr:1-acyl-sn-glycerol-3-phosphate acyltransferase [Spirochaetales bacterium]
MEGKNSQRNKTLIYTSIRFRILSAGVYTLMIMAMKLVFPYLFGHEVIGRENLKSMDGGIAVSNHCTYLDPGFIAKALYREKIYFSIQKQTVDIRGFGFFLRCLHGFPLPEDRPMDIAAAVKILLEKQALIHFFPEGVLYDYNQEITEFHAGPFYFALKNNVPVIPVTNVLKERIILGKTLKPPWVKIITVIGPAIYPPEETGVDSRDLAADYAESVRNIMQEIIDNQGGDKELFNGKIEHRI